MDAIDQDDMLEVWCSDTAKKYSKLPQQGKIKLLKYLLERSSATEIRYLEENFKSLQFRDFITQLPLDVVEKLLKYFDVKTLCRMRKVSYKWKMTIDQCHAAWKVKCHQLGLNLKSKTAKSLLENGRETYKSLSVRMTNVFQELQSNLSFEMHTYSTIWGNSEGICLSNDLLVSYFQHGQVAVWDTRTRSSLCTTRIEGTSITCCKLRDGILLFGTCDGYLLSYDPLTLALNRRYSRHHGTVTSLAFSLDLGIILSGSSDKTVKLWSISEGKLLTTLTEHHSWVRSVTLPEIVTDKENVKFVSLDTENFILWQLKTREKIWKMDFYENHRRYSPASEIYLDDKYIWFFKHDNFSTKLCKIDVQTRKKYLYNGFISHLNGRVLLAITDKFAVVIDHLGQFTIHDIEKGYTVTTIDAVSDSKMIEERRLQQLTTRQFAIGSTDWMQGFDGFNHQNISVAVADRGGCIVNYVWKSST